MASTETTEPRNWTYLTGKAIGWLFLAGALAASYTHIVSLFEMLGLHGWQAFTAPIFIDGFAMLGRLARSHQFDAATRRTGLRVQIIATAISFVANVIAGDSTGARIFGAMVVTGYVVAELLTERMSPAATKAEAVKATRSAAAAKAAATRAANRAKAQQDEARKAEQAEAARERRALARKVREAELSAAADGDFPGIAPVSPAPELGYL